MESTATAPAAAAPAAEPASAPEAAPVTEPAAEPVAEAPAPEAALEKPQRNWADTIAYFQKLDPDAALHLQQMKADYTRKTQTAAELRAQAQADRAAIDQARTEMDALMATFTGIESGELPAYDPFDPKSVAEHAQRAFYEKHIKPMQEKAQQAQQQARLNVVKAKHPDIFDDGKTELAFLEFLDKRKGLGLQDGIEYWRIVQKANAADAKAAQQQATRAAARQAALTATRPATRTRARPAKPSRAELRKMTNRQILELSKEWDSGA